MARAPKKEVTQAEPQAAAETTKPKAAAKKPAAAKPVAAAPKKAAAPKAPAKPRAKKAAVSPEERYRMIQDAAYYIAEKHGFTGDNHAFWLQAEQEIDAKLAAK